VLRILELDAKDDLGGALDPGAFADEKIAFESVSELPERPLT